MRDYLLMPPQRRIRLIGHHRFARDIHDAPELPLRQPHEIFMVAKNELPDRRIALLRLLR